MNTSSITEIDCRYGIMNSVVNAFANFFIYIRSLIIYYFKVNIQSCLEAASVLLLTFKYFK